MAFFSIYNTISSTNWYPVDFQSITDDFSFSKDTVVFSNGINVYLHDFLENAEDFSFNRKTGLVLTNATNNTLFLENKHDPSLNEPLQKIQTPLMVSIDSTDYVVSPMPYTDLYNNPKRTTAQNRDFDKNDVLTFIFSQNNTVFVQDVNNNFLTWQGIGEGNLWFKKQISPPSTSQQFEYILSDDSIMLFQYGTNLNNIAIINPATNNLILSSVYISKSGLFPTNSIFKFSSYKSYELDSSNAVLDSFIVTYEASPIMSQKELMVNNDNNDSNILAQNFLAAFPVENPAIGDNDSKYFLQFIGLKNYQTAEYTYSASNPYFDGVTTSISRLYNKLYTGTNQNKGYNNIFLGYQANTQPFVFPANQETYFYYPATNSRKSINDAGFIEDGAVASSIPFNADRLYVHRQNYEEITPGVPQPPSIKKTDNTWFCAWLSGSESGSKMWMDRYYNAAYYTLDQVLTSKAIAYNDRIDLTKPYTYDVPSSIMMEPGVLYKYYRIGKEDSKNFVSSLNFNSTSLGINVLSLNDWSTSPVIDSSKYHNNGIVKYNKNPLNFNKNYFVLDGTSSVILPARSSLLQSDKLTVSLWLTVDDWSNIQGEQIFGNYYSSGFGLINDQFISAPLFTIVNNSTLSAYNINYNLIQVAQTPVPHFTDSENSIVIRLPDLTYWIFDRVNLVATKFSPTNAYIKTITNDLSDNLNDINQVEIDSQQNLYVYDNSTKTYVTFDMDGNMMDSLTVDSRANRIEIDLNDNVITIYGTSSVIDNKNNIWEVIGGNLYKNRIMYGTVGVTQQLTVDSSNRLWISHLQDTISILDIEKDLFIKSSRLGELTRLPIDPCRNQEIFRSIDFVTAPTTDICGNVSFEDRLVILDTRDNMIYVLNSDLNLLAKLDLNTFIAKGEVLAFNANGDFTGFQYIRKFGNYKTKNLSWKLKIAELNGYNSELVTLSYNVSSLPPGWHNFVLTFDSSTGTATYYIDSIQVDQFISQSYQSNYIHYDYRSSLLIGEASVLNTSLNEIIGVDNEYKFKGKIANVNMYSSCFSTSEIKELYFSSDYSEQRGDLIWNMDTGKRNYIEEIEHMFKFQLPGSKSKYFNINIHNLNIDNIEIKKIIEDAIRNNISRITPAESSLYKINWL